MMPFSYHSGLDRAFHGTGSRLNTLFSFAKAMLAPGLQKTVREPKDHPAIRLPTPSRESYRADTSCQPVKTASGALVRAKQTSNRILLCLMTEVLNGISVQRRFIQPH